MRRAAKPEQQAALEELVAFVNECNKEEVSVMEEENGVVGESESIKENGTVKESESLEDNQPIKDSESLKDDQSSKDNESIQNNESSKDVMTEEPTDSHSSKDNPRVPTTPTKRSPLSSTHTPILESRLSAKKRSSHMTTPESSKKRKVVQSDSDCLVCCHCSIFLSTNS